MMLKHFIFKRQVVTGFLRHSQLFIFQTPFKPELMTDNDL